MTRRYAQNSNRVVANECAAVGAKVEALYSTDAPLPADTIGPNMRRMRNVNRRRCGAGRSVSGRDCERVRVAP